jgi:rRNA-processing protein FCF1
MRLTTVNVGIPVFTLKASVQHSIVRKPTVFERMVLRLSRRGQANQVVGGATLRQAFEERLGVQGVPQLLETTVSGLVRLGVLSAPGTPRKSLLDEPIQTFRLTREGEEFYNRNTLPSRPTADAVDYSYAPWSNALSTARPGKLAEVSPGLAFDDAILRPRDPSSLVRRELEENRPRFLKKESRIIDVDAETSESVGWLTVDIEIHASPDGYLDLKTQGKAYENWLHKLEPAVVQATFLDAVIGKTSAPDLELNREVLEQAKRLALASAHSTPSAPIVTLPAAGEGGLTITLSPVDDVPQLTHGPSGHAVISCPAPTTVPPQVVSVTVDGGQATGCLLEGSVALTWASGLRDVHVQADLDGEDAARYWKPFSDDLAASLAASTDSKVSIVPLLWGSDRPMDSLSQRLASLPLSPSLEKIGEFLTAAGEAGATFSTDHADRLAGLLAERIESTADAPMLNMSLVDEWLGFIARSLGTGTSSEALRTALLSKATPPSSALEVRQLLALESNPHKIPSRLLGPGVMAAVLEELWNDPQHELVTGDVDSLQSLEAYRSAQASLDARLGRHNADLGATGRRVVANKSVGEARRAAEKWLAAVDDPKLSQATGESFPTRLLQFREKVRAWRDAANANLVPAIGPDQIALVFDSNTLLDHPDALLGLTSSQIGVIPSRVIQELDGLKRSSDESRARKARAANRTIDGLRERNSLRLEKARTDLIPSDFGSTDDPDNQILSVAVAFTGSKVTLVTGDKNLRAKAEASNIQARDWPSLKNAGGRHR